MNKSIKRGIAVAVLALTFGQAAHAATVTKDHSITVAVPSFLSMTADKSDFTLTFADYITGSETNTDTVTYSVRANNLDKTNGVVSAKLDSLYDNVTLKADPGAYSKVNGNASLTEAAAGFIAVDASGVSLMNKTVDNGTGKTTRGSFPVIYKASADQDLSVDAFPQVRVLTVTFANA